MSTLISTEPVVWFRRTCRALIAAIREIMNAMTAVTPHGTSVTGIAPMRTPTPLPSSQSRVPSPIASTKLPESAASQPRIVTPTQRIQLASGSHSTAHESDDSPTALCRSGVRVRAASNTFAASRVARYVSGAAAFETKRGKA